MFILFDIMVTNDSVVLILVNGMLDSLDLNLIVLAM